MRHREGLPGRVRGPSEQGSQCVESEWWWLQSYFVCPIVHLPVTKMQVKAGSDLPGESNNIF